MTKTMTPALATRKQLRSASVPSAVLDRNSTTTRGRSSRQTQDHSVFQQEVTSRRSETDGAPARWRYESDVTRHSPDPLDWANGDLWMQPLCANTRLCTNAGCLVRSLPVLGASDRDL